MRVIPKLWKRFSQAHVINLQIATVGSGGKKSNAQQLVAIPFLKVVAASHGEKRDRPGLLHDAPVGGMIAATNDRNLAEV
jgi:hypothetical protein